MRRNIALDNDTVYYGNQETADRIESMNQEQPTMSRLSNGNKNSLLSDPMMLSQIPKTAVQVPEQAPIRPSSTMISATKSSPTSSGFMVAYRATSYRSLDNIVHYLEHVGKHMDHLGAHIKAQKKHGKPLYQWQKYGDYSTLKTAVSELEKAIAKFKPERVLPEYLDDSVARATYSSTSVSKAAVYVLEAINQKATEYMEEMESSHLGEDAKAQANVVIREEVGRLMEHSARATEQVWRATDMLRECKEKRRVTKDWAWSMAATVMTAFIAAAVAIFVAHLYGVANPDLVTGRADSMSMYHLVSDLFERTEAVTNLTSEIYNSKLQQMDQRYTSLAELTESNGIRIDNIVDSLGPPNSEGTYYSFTPNTNDATCEARIRKMSGNLARQLKRQQEDMAMMRKHVHRMDIRLTEGVKKAQKR